MVVSALDSESSCDSAVERTLAGFIFSVVARIFFKWPKKKIKSIRSKNVRKRKTTESFWASSDKWPPQRKEKKPATRHSRTSSLTVVTVALRTWGGSTRFCCKSTDVFVCLSSREPCRATRTSCCFRSTVSITTIYRSSIAKGQWS